jgi:hypothetical protein
LCLKIIPVAGFSPAACFFILHDDGRSTLECLELNVLRTLGGLTPFRRSHVTFDAVKNTVDHQAMCSLEEVLKPEKIESNEE